MTNHFRVDSMVLETTEGDVSYDFTSDLTVLAGPTGVGKTTLMELVKFGFGCEGKLSSVATDYVTAVALDVQVGDERFRLARNVDQDKRQRVRVTDLITRERLPDHNVGAQQPSLSSLLLTSLGLPDDMRAAAGGNSSKEGNRITFADLLTYLYVPQYEINRDIAHSQDSYREPKRRTVFELLFGLVNPDILAMRSELNRLKGSIESAERHHQTVVAFLRESGTTGRVQVEEMRWRAEVDQRAAERQLRALRDEIQPAVDRETRVLRDLLTETERRLADVRAAETDTARRLAEFLTERARIDGDLARLRRMRDAGERLADIEFSVCPRCTQALKRTDIPHDVCRLCLQPDIVPTDEVVANTYETRQLLDQVDEMNDQIAALTSQQTINADAVREQEGLVAHLGRALESRTADRVTPRLQAFSDASQRMAAARERQSSTEGLLRQWDRVSDLELTADKLRAERSQLAGRLKRATDLLEERKSEILNEISQEFKNVVEAIGVPGITSASIDERKYLPVLNGKPYSQVVQVGGGQTTAVQVAYWLSLLAVSLRRRDTYYPAFMILDSPRLALNTATSLTAALYSRVVAQVDSTPGRVQIIVADNELPSEYRGGHVQINFDYLSPTVSTIEHPGEDNVLTIDGSTPALS